MTSEVFVDQSLNVVFVPRPKTPLFVPNSIEGTALDHQITTTPDREIRVNLDTDLGFFRNDLIEIHRTSFL